MRHSDINDPTPCMIIVYAQAVHRKEREKIFSAG